MERCLWTMKQMQNFVGSGSNCDVQIKEKQEHCHFGAYSSCFRYNGRVVQLSDVKVKFGHKVNKYEIFFTNL